MFKVVKSSVIGTQKNDYWGIGGLKETSFDYEEIFSLLTAESSGENFLSQMQIPGPSKACPIFCSQCLGICIIEYVSWSLRTTRIEAQ